MASPASPFPPTVCVAITLITLVAIAAVPLGSWLTLGAYGVGMGGLFLWQGIAWGQLGRRVAVELGLISIILVGNLGQGEGEVYGQWGMITLTQGGLTLLGTLLLKALLSLSLVNALQQCLTLPQFLDALLQLHCPPLFVAIMGSMLRYGGTVERELQRMILAARSRNGWSTPQAQRHSFGHILAGSFLRTLHRGEKIHQAMVARGYTSSFIPPSLAPLTRRDYGIITGFTLLAIAPHMWN